MNSRRTVLDRIRSALTDVPAAESYDAKGIPRDYRRSHAEGDLVDLFAGVAAGYRATVTRTTEPRAAIGTALIDRSVSGTLVVPEGFPADWLPDGDWTRRSDTPPLDVCELDTAEGVLTTCALAIATTGTIVLDAGPGQGRRALTLLPDYHLCVLRSDQIAPDVPEAVRRLAPRRPLTLISGPSATSDIELERVEGVHGPRTLDIVIIDD
ncbi:LutC/YkgG family protein [Streptomyces inhibens]|uniref:LutC/YkgG family protein n=1 Tax=Streptomyces inhibens TaxID=2293571 RepID=UPI001EE7386F|nr:LUD domain-containing protein [Streptomyces inhibens]UKY48580.1 LUD domain-containing protein [Streptomyces inhibens]